MLQLIGDLTNESFNEKLISATVDKFGKLDVLVSSTTFLFHRKVRELSCEENPHILISNELFLQVNNAGGGAIEAWGKAMFDLPVSDFDKMIEQNVKP